MGLSMSQWDALDDHDRAWALALEVAEAKVRAEVEAATCPVCGGPKAECQDPDNQHAYDVTLARCFKTRAVDAAKRKRESDPDLGSLIVKAVLNPDKKKSARKKR